MNISTTETLNLPPYKEVVDTEGKSLEYMRGSKRKDPVDKLVRALN